MIRFHPLSQHLLLPLTVTVLLSTALPVLAQEPTDRDWRALLVDDQTVALLELNLEAIEPSAVLAWALEQDADAQRAQAELTTAVAMADGVLGTLRTAGAARLFATATAQNLLTGGVVAIPCEQTQVVANLLELAAAQLPPEAGYRVHTDTGLVALSSDAAWDRLQQRIQEPKDSVSLPDRFAAIAADETLPHSLAISLPERLRRELAAIWPDRLPAAAPLELSPRQLAADIRTVSLRLRLPPEPRAELRLMTENQAATERVAETLRGLAGQLALPEAQREIEGGDMTVVVRWDADAVRALLQRLLANVQTQVGQAKISNQLKQIALAMHNYADTFGHLPPRMTVDAAGRPLLSWRVHLLPFLEQQALYRQFHLDEPWDSPHNLPLSETTPAPFRIAGDDLPPGHTRFRLPQIEGSLWQGEGPPRTFRDVTDGTSNTLAAAVAPPDQSVIWTKPEPWPLDPENLISSFFGDAESTWVFFLDGSVHELPRSIDAEKLKAFLTHAGGEVVERP